MEIKSVDFQEKSPAHISVLLKPLIDHIERRRAKKLDVPNVTTTIILEKILYEENDRFVRGRKTCLEKEVNSA
jgi:hypothetical protein